MPAHATIIPHLTSGLSAQIQPPYTLDCNCMQQGMRL